MPNLIEVLRVRIMSVAPILGTAPGDPKIYSEYVAKKRAEGADPKEVEDLPKLDLKDEIARGTTWFMRDFAMDKTGKILYFPGYWVKGNAKSNCGLLRRSKAPEKPKKKDKDAEGREIMEEEDIDADNTDAPIRIGTESSKLQAYMKVIDGGIHIVERKVHLHLPEGMEPSICERPLRIGATQECPQDRVALARSEQVPEGTTAEFTMVSVGESRRKLIEEWLSQGRWNGLGQWRNSGMGQYVYKILEHIPTHMTTAAEDAKYLPDDRIRKMVADFHSSK